MTSNDDNFIRSFFAKSTPVDSELPHRESVLESVMALRDLKNTGLGRVQFQNIHTEDVPAFLQGQHFIDADVEIAQNLCFLNIRTSEFGSGVSSDLTAAACHAACEAFERLLPKLGGMRGSRESEFSVFSIKNNHWCELPYNPLNRVDEQNPFREVSCGQAVHPNPTEALRNAFCELIERNSIASLKGNERWYDITESLVAANYSLLQTQQHWDMRGFVFQIAATISPHGAFVVVASAINRTPGGFPASYRGSASDFSLNYAPAQAVSELNRSGHFGPYVGIETIDEARIAQREFPRKDYHFGFLSRLMETDWLAICAKDATTCTLREIKNIMDLGPHQVAQSILSFYSDIYVIPYCDHEKLNLYGYKICIPDFPVAALERTSF
jgi:hypothetical protein